MASSTFGRNSPTPAASWRWPAALPPRLSCPRSFRAGRARSCCTRATALMATAAPTALDAALALEIACPVPRAAARARVPPLPSRCLIRVAEAYNSQKLRAIGRRAQLFRLGLGKRLHAMAPTSFGGTCLARRRRPAARPAHARLVSLSATVMAKSGLRRGSLPSCATARWLQRLPPWLPPVCSRPCSCARPRPRPRQVFRGAIGSDAHAHLRLGVNMTQQGRRQSHSVRRNACKPVRRTCRKSSPVTFSAHQAAAVLPRIAFSGSFSFGRQCSSNMPVLKWVSSSSNAAS